VAYIPAGYDGSSLSLYLQAELQRVSDAIQNIEDNSMQQRHVAPDKPRDGLFYADGTDWDPGSGKGIYRFDEGTDTFTFVG